MKLKHEDGTTLDYYFNSVDKITGCGSNSNDHNVSRSYRQGAGPTSTDHMTHDDAVADIRYKTQNGFSIIEF